MTRFGITALVLSAFYFLGCTPSGVHAIVPLADTGPGGEGAKYDFGNLRDAEHHTDATCGATSSQIGLLPLDMLIALDTSFSMDFNGKWNAVSSAIKAFSSNTKFSGLGVGMQYFPLRKQCNSDDYALPAVAFATLPGVGTQLGQSLDQQRMSGGTPMVPMLEGVVKYARSWSTANPQRRVVIVLATDGIPDDSCIAPAPGSLANTIANVVKVAGQAVATAPKIKIFVVGVGTELTALNQISQAGGTGTAILVDTSKDIQGAFIAAQWANALVDRLNIFLRAREAARIQANLAYLNEELMHTQVAEVRQSLFTLISKEHKKMMLVNTQKEFAFRILDPATPPVETARPMRLLITVVSSLLAAVMAVFLVFYRDGARKRSARYAANATDQGNRDPGPLL